MANPPAQQTFLTAEWRDLVMLNYEVDPALLLPHVPAGTVLDSWQGSTLISLVGFRFLDTRVRGIAIPWHRDFDEVNLRFYVRRDAPDGTRRGVVFKKEIVPRRAIAWVARAVYSENYVAMPMRHSIELPPPEGKDVGHAAYEWRFRGRRFRHRWNRLAARTHGAAELPPPGSEEEFVTEHYWGYAAQPDGGTLEYRVEHPQWLVWRATSAFLSCDATALYGAELGPYLSGSPHSAFVAEGSTVTVRRGLQVR